MATPELIWPTRTVVRYIESDGTLRASVYRRKRNDRPGTAERRQHALIGERWCRGCRAWLASDCVLRQGVCQPCANAEYRANYAANPAPIRLRTRARARNLDPIPSWWARERLDAFAGMCAYGCGRAAGTWDHIWPVSRGGISTPGNLVPACRTCNSRKRASLPAPWIERGLAAFPAEWFDVLAVAVEHGTDEWEAAA